MMPMPCLPLCNRPIRFSEQLRTERVALMSAPPGSSIQTISPAEMQILVSRTGLVLNPGQMADLVLAWRQLAGLIASIPKERPLADDLAFSFRLPAPAAAGTPRRSAKKARLKAAKPPEKAPGKGRSKAKAPRRRRATPGR